MSGPTPRYTEQQIRDALAKAATVKDAARALGISRRGMYDYLERYGIKVTRAPLVPA